MVPAFALLAGTALLALLLPEQILLRFSCPCRLKRFLTGTWEQYPTSYEWSAIVAGWLTTVGILALLALASWPLIVATR